MYQFLEHLGPDEVYVIARQAFVEMLVAGYTSVGEFHYLHNAPDGQAYADPDALVHSIFRAAADTGIHLCILPTLYERAGFDDRPVARGQRRFFSSIDDFLGRLERLREATRGSAQIDLGMAIHSLRAVSVNSIREVLADAADILPDSPIHIHVAEQQGEVDQCLATIGRRPVEVLLDEFAVDGRWCVIHATHMTLDETRRLAASGAVVGLCPTTEANLGDGTFRANSYCQFGGQWGIGSDSQVTIDPCAELRWLEYSQRLVDQRRVVLATDEASCGRFLVQRALAGGEQALGGGGGRLAAGRRADWIVVDPDHVSLGGRQGDRLLDALVFHAGRAAIRDVFVAGRPLVSGGHHRLADESARQFVATVRRLRVEL
jgi:formimidoylglutamate deiminase